MHVEWVMKEYQTYSAPELVRDALKRCLITSAERAFEVNEFHYLTGAAESPTMMP